MYEEAKKNRADRAIITSTVMKLYFIKDRDFMHAYAHRLLQASGFTHDEIFEHMRRMAMHTTSHLARWYSHWMKNKAGGRGNPHVLSPEQSAELKPMFEKVFSARTEEEVFSVLVSDPYFKDNAFPAMKQAVINEIEAATKETKDELKAICEAVSIELTKPSSPWITYFPKKYEAADLFAVFDKPQEVDFDTRYLEIVKLIDTMQRVMYFVGQDLATLDSKGFTMKAK